MTQKKGNHTVKIPTIATKHNTDFLLSLGLTKNLIAKNFKISIRTLNLILTNVIPYADEDNTTDLDGIVKASTYTPLEKRLDEVAPEILTIKRLKPIK